MSADRDVTRIVRSWLEEGRTALPDRVLDAVLDQLPATPQRRATWPARRSFNMTIQSRIAVAIAAVIALALIGALALPRVTGVAGPGGSQQQGVPAASASDSGAAAAPSTPVVFASTLYPYSITLPIGWVPLPAVTTWDGKSAAAIDDAAVDAFGPARAPVAFGSAARTTSPLATWVADGIAASFRDHSDTCPQTPDSTEPIMIGGQPGTLVAWNCGILINTAFTVVNGYGYRFGFRDPSVQAATNPADKALFTTLLGSVVFR
jgi:hypothetical protein